MAKSNPITDALAGQPGALTSGPPPRLQSLDLIRAARAEQTNDLNRLRRIVAEVQADVGGVDPGLRPDVHDARVSKAREAARQRSIPILERMRERASAAKAQAPLWTRGAVLLRAKFKGDPAADAAQRSDWRERLRSGSDGELLEAARLAASTRDLPLAAVVGEVARGRDFQTEAAAFEVEAVLAGVEVPASDRALEALAETADLADDGELEARTAATGWLDPAMELEAALRERRAG
ncbi:MAG TPA: hypothetical protein VLF66_19230 [Thermoanaerobaculia bacterium]|nr:hypothetical protein [Thermoanaerobaculia bacterium]